MFHPLQDQHIRQDRQQDRDKDQRDVRPAETGDFLKRILPQKKDGEKDDYRHNGIDEEQRERGDRFQNLLIQGIDQAPGEGRTNRKEIRGIHGRSIGSSGESFHFDSKRSAEPYKNSLDKRVSAWLRGKDLNLNYLGQNQASYR